MPAGAARRSLRGALSISSVARAIANGAKVFERARPGAALALFR
jgi:hypothetical protein